MDGSGTLDKEETSKFVLDTMTKLGKAEHFSEEMFAGAFADMDKDGSGVIERSEMVAMLEKMMGPNM